MSSMRDEELSLSPPLPPQPPPPPPALVGPPSAPPPPQASGRGKSFSGLGKGHGVSESLKKLYWSEVTQVKGTLWDKEENKPRPLKIDVTELARFFSNPTTKLSRSSSSKPEKVQLVETKRKMNVEISLSGVKTSEADIIDAVLNLDFSALEIEEVERIIKICPTKEEMELLTNYRGDSAMLGKCEKFFMEVMKVLDDKLRVYRFMKTFVSEVEELKETINLITAATKEVKESDKLRQIMHAILTLGNALNQGTARGSAKGFKLETLLKLPDTCGENTKFTLMHYLCKIVGEQMPELLDFAKDLVHLEAASNIDVKALKKNIEAVNKDLKMVQEEYMASEKDGEISLGFRKVLNEKLLPTAVTEVMSLNSLSKESGEMTDSLCQYFGEDPRKYSFKEVTTTLTLFMKTFIKSREENAKQADTYKRG